MNIDQAVLALENSRNDPVPAIEFLIADPGDSANALLARLASLQAGNRPAFEIAVARSHLLPHGAHLRWPWRPSSPATNLAIRRIVIALGVIRSVPAIPALLDIVARVSDDTPLSETLGWALANIGEAALLPLFAFACRRTVLPPARALAITTLGYIPDPRLPTILRHLWREYRAAEPSLAIAALLGLTTCGQGAEARKLAAEMERLWLAQRSLHDALRGMGVNSVDELLNHKSGTMQDVELLATWPNVVQMLGRR